MMITTMLIAVPTGIKIFSWLATLWRGVIHLRTPMLFALGFITMFTLGGISGIMLAVVPFDIHVSDTYFIVAHIHYVLFGGSVFTIFAGLYHWFPKMTGRMYDETLGKLHFWMSFIGIGCFDYWFRWASGAPTIPEDHSGHGAYSWRDYFRVNTDHKVIGIQYICTTFFFFVAGGLMAMLMRAELAQPGTQFVDPNTFNGLFSVHASLMIFLFIIPVFAGIANYVIPLMIGAPDMAFPRLNALSFWMLPMAGVMMLARFFAEGGAFATGWTAYAPLSTDTPMGQQFFTLGVQFAGASSIATALNFLVTIITMRAPGHDVLAHAAARVGELHDLAAGRDRHPVHRRLAVLRAARPHARHPLLRPGRGRRRADVPARLLVLLAPGGLHHDAAGLRDHQRGHLDARPEAGVRLPDDGVLAGGDRDPRLHGLGAPHVRVRACRAGCASR